MRMRKKGEGEEKKTDGNARMTDLPSGG